jgi:hypothetical protein
LEQFVPLQAGARPPLVVSAPHAIPTAPFAWLIAVGTVWHSAQATARLVPPDRCTWCAPTARVVVAVSPLVPAGGAAFAAEPWQVEQVCVTTLRTPSTCVALTTVVLV